MGHRPGPDHRRIPRRRSLGDHRRGRGPGLKPEQRKVVLARGKRLDETVPGSGLGLAICSEIAGLYGGGLSLDAAALGGLEATLDLPRAEG